MANLTEALRAALRIKSTAFDDEIAALIQACKMDLDVAGASKFDELDPLCVQAAIFYGKANFGFSGDEGNQYQARYEALRAAMAHSSKYGSVGEGNG